MPDIFRRTFAKPLNENVYNQFHDLNFQIYLLLKKRKTLCQPRKN